MQGDALHHATHPGNEFIIHHHLSVGNSSARIHGPDTIDDAGSLDQKRKSGDGLLEACLHVNLFRIRR